MVIIMTIISSKDVRKLSREQRLKRIDDYKKKLFEVKSQLSAGGSIQNPGQIKEYKKAISRILTIMSEEEEKI